MIGSLNAWRDVLPHRQPRVPHHRQSQQPRLGGRRKPRRRPQQLLKLPPQCGGGGARGGGGAVRVEKLQRGVQQRHQEAQAFRAEAVVSGKGQRPLRAVQELPNLGVRGARGEEAPRAERLPNEIRRAGPRHRFRFALPCAAERRRAGAREARRGDGEEAGGQRGEQLQVELVRVDKPVERVHRAQGLQLERLDLQQQQPHHLP
mmetsp:Transcript_32433/g.95747  ORF Transcript_32433/g.95747 Transcript_32433/m.95747 type:complete len:204 (+) Transcript_32433:1355-1966(+)